MQNGAGADTLTAAFKSELEAWSHDRPKWQRHALWIIATKDELTSEDLEALENCLFKECGIIAADDQDEETLFKSGDLNPHGGDEPKLLRLSEIKNVNRLDSAGVSFKPVGLTTIYGENGSGKTGLIRIIRKACRTRVEKPADLEILANVYGKSDGVASAAFTLQIGELLQTIPWEDDQPPSEALSAFRVFDTRSAQLYVDEGNKLRFLPFGLDVPFRLNEAIMAVEARLHPLLASMDGQLASQQNPFPPSPDITPARLFFDTISGATTDQRIAEECQFSEENEARLATLEEALKSSPSRAAELKNKAAAVRTIVNRLKNVDETLSPTKLDDYCSTLDDARRTAAAHSDASRVIEGVSPLDGIGSESWRRLWQAARAYVAEIQTDTPFPSAGPLDRSGLQACPLCQEQITPSATSRLCQFEAFVSGTTGAEAEAATARLTSLRASLSALNCEISESDAVLIDDLGVLDESLPLLTTESIKSAQLLKQAWLVFDGITARPLHSDSAPLITQLERTAAHADLSAAEILKAQDATLRGKMEQERAELADCKALSNCSDTLKIRRDLLKKKEALAQAQANCRRTEVTKKANAWVDSYLTNAVKELFNEELRRFSVNHLNVTLSRQSSPTETGYKNVLQDGKGFRKVSDVLSEGEQRALSLAAFFTEAALERPEGTVIIDDPVSSLDRRRSKAVAAKIVAESSLRQVIVFTHDAVFLDELSEEARLAGVPFECQRLFATPIASGKIDEAGPAWKTQPVVKRLNYIEGKLPALKNLHETSPTEYEFEAKGLYGRIRDACERFIEEILFGGVILRYRDEIQTRRLRSVTVSTDVARAVYQMMSKASFHSHDNPSARDVTAPAPTEIETDMIEFWGLLDKVQAEQKATEKERSDLK